MAFSKLDPETKVVQNLILYNIALGHILKFQTNFEMGFKVYFKSNFHFSRLFLKAKFEELLNTKLAPNFMLNIYK
jgi:hypothetical protein